MKKFLAVIMSLVMMFSLAALPVAAADSAEAEKETTAESITLNDVFDTIELTVELLEDTVEKIHFIVGTILGMLDKECPLCTEVHEITSAEGDESVENEIPEDVQELLK